MLPWKNPFRKPKESPAKRTVSDKSVLEVAKRYELKQVSGDTFGFLESSWNRGILSRMVMTRQTGDGILEIR